MRLPICRFATLFLVVALAQGAAFAHTSLALEELTSTEVAAAVRAGKTTILIPIGGTEQNGDHIALGKHNARARVLAEAIAARLGNALVAPVIAYVPEGAIEPPTGHMRAAGTITIPEDAFEKTLESAAASFFKHGFTAVVFLGDHGGYQRSLRKVADRMNRGGKDKRALAPPEYYREMEHAGRDDTALTLATAPSMVRDPRGAVANSGRELRERIVLQTAEAVRKALTR